MTATTDAVRAVLEFTALTDSGRALDIAFPLHPQSGSPEAVAGLITALLQGVSAQVAQHADLSAGDVLQALAMTMAIRGRLMDDGSDAGEQLRQLQHELLDVAQEAVREAREYRSGRA